MDKTDKTDGAASQTARPRQPLFPFGNYRVWTVRSRSRAGEARRGEEEKRGRTWDTFPSVCRASSTSPSAHPGLPSPRTRFAERKRQRDGNQSMGLAGYLLLQSMKRGEEEDREEEEGEEEEDSPPAPLISSHPISSYLIFVFE